MRARTDSKKVAFCARRFSDEYHGDLSGAGGEQLNEASGARRNRVFRETIMEKPRGKIVPTLFAAAYVSAIMRVYVRDYRSARYLIAAPPEPYGRTSNIRGRATLFDSTFIILYAGPRERKHTRRQFYHVAYRGIRVV